MGCFTYTRAIFVRLLFTVHGIVSIWRLYLVTREPGSWYIAMALVGLLAESIVTIYKNRGHEWKCCPQCGEGAIDKANLISPLERASSKTIIFTWGTWNVFCPSVLFYLLCVVPAIWLLELDEMERRISQKEQANLTNAVPLLIVHDAPDDLRAKIQGLGIEINIPLKLSADQWLRSLEQILLLFLIVGRWLLPKGKLTHDQLSQLLLVYIGTAADIVEFFEAFKEDQVRYNRILCHVILAIWSWSLLQFTLVLTATKARRDRSGVLSRYFNQQQKSYTCCLPDVYGIVISIIMQDLPYLILRLLLIFKYGVLSYTNMFFTCKNTLVIMLLLYRLVVVQVERKRTPNDSSQIYYQMSESGSKSKLLSTGVSQNNNYNSHKHTNLSNWNDFQSKIDIRDVQIDPKEPRVQFTLRPHIKPKSVEEGFTEFIEDDEIIEFKPKANGAVSSNSPRWHQDSMSESSSLNQLECSTEDIHL